MGGGIRTSTSQEGKAAESEAEKNRKIWGKKLVRELQDLSKKGAPMIEGNRRPYLTGSERKPTPSQGGGGGGGVGGQQTSEQNINERTKGNNRLGGQITTIFRQNSVRI